MLNRLDQHATNDWLPNIVTVWWPSAALVS